ncbi:methyltransferase-like protein 17, mitochondrial isoform X2 [Tachysurus vachellii]|uniref:methyltransferase-like protein 17, mitochondrial isoform X2 n=1 Tax=Tachysurus vachellii TaxID=175792 RepID=UPI00296B033E|nr:methyltransferase-like protein 17, mitochondrial isoform X2 [Tachysurus vachellii]
MLNTKFILDTDMFILYRRLYDVCCRAAVPVRCKTVAVPFVQPEFLKGSVHRKHPGVTNLKTIRLPEELHSAALSVIYNSEVKDLPERAHKLTNFLWSRKRAVESHELRERAIALEKKWKEQERVTDTNHESFETRIRKKILSELKKTTYHWTPLNDLGLVYMVARLAGGYAAVMRALNEIKKRDSSFTPHSLLDFGSGLGTALWAAHTHWGDSLREYVCVDASAAMNSLAERLLTGDTEGDDPLIKHVYFRQFLPVSPKVQADLVLAAFSLSELSTQEAREETLLTLWRKTNSYLVLVENGTKAGHQILMEAKDILLKREDKVGGDVRRPLVFAPCTHQLPCPKLLKQPVTPCNFLQPYYPLPVSGRSEIVQEKFSFLIMSRSELQKSELVQWSRLISPVLRRSRHVQCEICCSNGELQQLAITARHHGRDSYRCTRSSDWGDRLPVIQMENHTEG